MAGETLGERFRFRTSRRRDHELREVRRTLELALEDRPPRRRAPTDAQAGRHASDRVIDLTALERDEDDVHSPLFPPPPERSNG